MGLLIDWHLPNTRAIRISPPSSIASASFFKADISLTEPSRNMRSHGSLANDAEANQAANIAIRGAGIGALKYGAFLLPLSVLGHQISPIYRGLTIQFKVFLLMGGMILGGAIEGDRRMREFEELVRRRKRAAL